MTLECGDGISDVKLTRIVWIPASHILFSGSPSAAAEFPGDDDHRIQIVIGNIVHAVRDLVEKHELVMPLFSLLSDAAQDVHEPESLPEGRVGIYIQIHFYEHTFRTNLQF